MLREKLLKIIFIYTPVFVNLMKKWLQPSFCTLAVGIKKGNHLTLRQFCTYSRIKQQLANEWSTAF